MVILGLEEMDYIRSGLCFTPKTLTIFYLLLEIIRKKCPIFSSMLHIVDKCKKGMLEDHYDTVVYMLPRNKLWNK